MEPKRSDRKRPRDYTAVLYMWMTIQLLISSTVYLSSCLFLSNAVNKNKHCSSDLDLEVLFGTSILDKYKTVMPCYKIREN